MIPHRLRRRLSGALVTAALATAAAVGSAPHATAAALGSAPHATAAGAGPFCGITWGSLAKSSPAGPSLGTMLDIRTGQHACFDRMVVDFAGPVGGYSVQYDPEHRLFSSSDPAFYPRGGAYLVISLRNKVIPAPPPGHHTTAADSADEAADVSGFRTFRQIRDLIYGPTVDGHTVGNSLALGVRARLPFRVFTLAGPGDGARLVIDVAHRW